MAAPSYVQASAGAVMTGTSQVVTLSGATVGDVIWFQALNDGTAGNTGVGSISGVEALDATANSMTYVGLFGVGSPQTASQEFWVGRATASSISITFSTDNATDAYLRIYEFTGVAAGTTLASIMENGGGTTGTARATSTTIADQSVVTNGADRLALNFVATDATSTIAAFSGETGGDWVECIAEYAPATGTLGTIQLQKAIMPTAGTIDGGTATITSAGWGVMGTALIGTTTAISYMGEVGTRSHSGSGATSIALTVSRAPAAGNLIVLGVVSSNAELQSVSDSKGNTWTIDTHTVNSQAVAICSTTQDVGTLAAADTITMTFPANVFGLCAIAEEFSDIKPTGYVDRTATNTGTSTARDGGTTAATSQADEVVVAIFSVSGTESSFVPGANYSLFQTHFLNNGDGTNSLMAVHKILSATGAQHPTGTGAVNGAWAGVTGTYEAAPAAAVPTRARRMTSRSTSW